MYMELMLIHSIGALQSLKLAHDVMETAMLLSFKELAMVGECLAHEDVGTGAAMATEQEFFFLSGVG